jgi:hypothetical protein
MSTTDVAAPTIVYDVELHPHVRPDGNFRLLVDEQGNASIVDRPAPLDPFFGEPERLQDENDLPRPVSWIDQNGSEVQTFRLPNDALEAAAALKPQEAAKYLNDLFFEQINPKIGLFTTKADLESIQPDWGQGSRQETTRLIALAFVAHHKDFRDVSISENSIRILEPFAERARREAERPHGSPAARLERLLDNNLTRMLDPINELTEFSFGKNIAPSTNSSIFGSPFRKDMRRVTDHLVVPASELREAAGAVTADQAKAELKTWLESRNIDPKRFRVTERDRDPNQRHRFFVHSSMPVEAGYKSQYFYVYPNKDESRIVIGQSTVFTAHDGSRRVENFGMAVISPHPLGAHFQIFGEKGGVRSRVTLAEGVVPSVHSRASAAKIIAKKLQSHSNEKSDRLSIGRSATSFIEQRIRIGMKPCGILADRELDRPFWSRTAPEMNEYLKQEEFVVSGKGSTLRSPQAWWRNFLARYVNDHSVSSLPATESRALLREAQSQAGDDRRKAGLARFAAAQQYVIREQAAHRLPESLQSIPSWSKLEPKRLAEASVFGYTSSPAWKTFATVVWPRFGDIIQRHPRLLWQPDERNQRCTWEDCVNYLTKLPNRAEHQDIPQLFEEALNLGVGPEFLITHNVTKRSDFRYLNEVAEEIRRTFLHGDIKLAQSYEPPKVEVPEGWAWVDKSTFYRISSLYNNCFSNNSYYVSAFNDGVAHAIYLPDPENTRGGACVFFEFDRVGKEWTISEARSRGNDPIDDRFAAIARNIAKQMNSSNVAVIRHDANKTVANQDRGPIEANGRRDYLREAYRQHRAAPQVARGR